MPINGFAAKDDDIEKVELYRPTIMQLPAKPRGSQ